MWKQKNKRPDTLNTDWRYRISVEKNNWQRRWKGVPYSLGMALLMLFGGGALGAILILLTNLLLSSPLFAVTEIAVRGCLRVPPQEVIKMANITKGANIFLLDSSQIAKRVSGNPWVEETFVGREFPSRIVIEVRERQPFAIVKDDEGKLMFLDKTGHIFAPVDSNNSEWNIPILTGLPLKLSEYPLLRSQLLNLLEFLSQSNFPFLKWENIAEIKLDAEYGFSIISTDGLCLYTGFGEYPEKFQNLEKIFSSYGNRTHLLRLYVDMSNKNKIFIRKQSESGTFLRNTIPPGASSSGIVI